MSWCHMPGSLQILVSSFFVFGDLGCVIFVTMVSVCKARQARLLKNVNKHFLPKPTKKENGMKSSIVQKLNEKAVTFYTFFIPGSKSLDPAVLTKETFFINSSWMLHFFLSHEIAFLSMYNYCTYRLHHTLVSSK